MAVSVARQGVVVLGSTGSIGRSTLDVIAAHPDRFTVVALAAGRNVDILVEQVEQFHPTHVAATGALNPDHLTNVRIVDGSDALVELATLPEAEIVVVATTGHAAILPTIRALEAGKTVALANKETIVAAGELVMPLARSRPGALRPVDSEHSALWQCLDTDRVDPEQIVRLILTASGGPFRGWSRQQLAAVTPEQALRHPTWDMGSKITIDSATLMNKGLELIEAHWLFDCPIDRIDVVIHPQSIVHSFVEYVDGALLAQLGSHDMRLPIQYALTFPERIAGPQQRLDVLKLARLDFEPPDTDAFPALELAREAVRRGTTYPTVLSAVDAVAVQAFLDRRLSFTGIDQLISTVLTMHEAECGRLTLDAILDADAWATAEAERLLTMNADSWNR